MNHAIFIIQFSMIAFLIIFYLSFIAAAQRKPGVTAVFTSSNRYHLLKRTLDSFIKYNTYPLEKIIVVEDGPFRQSISKAIIAYPDIQILFTGKKVGQLMAIDLAYKQVQTKYVFHSEDDWEFLRSGLIQNDISQLQKDPKLLQMWNRKRHQNYTQKNYLKNKTMIWNGKQISTIGIGFSLNPAVHDMNLYDQLDNGYAGLTHNVSYGTGAGHAQSTIARHYNQLGYRIKQIQEDYIVHLGDKQHLQRYKP